MPIVYSHKDLLCSYTNHDPKQYLYEENSIVNPLFLRYNNNEHNLTTLTS